MKRELRVIHRASHLENGPMIIRDRQDVEELAKTVEGDSATYSAVIMYATDRWRGVGRPDHELIVGFRGWRRWASLYYADFSGEWYSYGRPSEAIRTYYRLLGSALRFPSNSRISVEAAIDAIEEFRVSGGNRPESVTWVEPPVGWYESEATPPGIQRVKI